jgi:hypothetical protein
MAAGNELTLLWNDVLRATSAASCGAWVALALTRTEVEADTNAAKSPARSKQQLFWDRVWQQRVWLTLLYVVACGIRATWPRQDGDRVCLWDHPLSPALVGRSLACCAEFAFAALVCAALVRILESPATPRIASGILAANAVAQTCCNYSVITRDQRGHVLEESIWTLSGISVVLMCANQLLKRGLRQHSSGFLLLSVVGGALYTVFMVTIDVPMYVRRSMEDAAAGQQFATIADGLVEISRCRVFSQADAYWAAEMPWMSLYFTVAVWASLWLGFARVAPAHAPMPRKKRA